MLPSFSLLVRWSAVDAGVAIKSPVLTEILKCLQKRTLKKWMLRERKQIEHWNFSIVTLKIPHNIQNVMFVRKYWLKSVCETYGTFLLFLCQIEYKSFYQVEADLRQQVCHILQCLVNCVEKMSMVIIELSVIILWIISQHCKDL